MNNRSFLPSISKISAIFFLFLAFYFFFNAQSFAATPQRFFLSSVNISEENQTLFADFSLAIDDENGFADMLRDGAVAELIITVQVKRKRSWWSDSTVSNIPYAYTLRHMPLTRDFVLCFPKSFGKNDIKDRNLSRLLHKTWRNIHLKAISLEDLKNEPPQREYEVIVSLSLRHKEVPPWLEKSSLFWSADIVPAESASTLYFY